VKPGEVTDIEVKEEGRAVSEKTAKDVLSMMESVVAERNSAEMQGLRDMQLEAKQEHQRTV
jgi:hypothetical protein